MVSIQRLEPRLRTGGPVILDGANGTELEHLGARMDQEVWCARALVDCPDMVHQVHRRYIDAGADVITTNSSTVTREAMQTLRAGRTLRRLESALGAYCPRGARLVFACGINRRGGIGQQLRSVRPTRPGNDVRSLSRSGRDSGQ